MKNNFDKNMVNTSNFPLRGLGGLGLKICGMKFSDNILEVSKLLPDYLGFIFYKKSERYFDGQIPEIPKSIKKVGVFVNETLKEVVIKIEKYNLDLVQLHGQESPEFCEKLYKNNQIEIIKEIGRAHV